MRRKEKLKRLKNLKRNQRKYILRAGGIHRVQEADDQFNDITRAQIKAFLDLYPDAFMGKFNCRITDESEPNLFFLGKEQKLSNFCCDFIVPSKDKELEKLLIEWNKYLVVHSLTAAMRRVEALGGICLTWK